MPAQTVTILGIYQQANEVQWLGEAIKELCNPIKRPGANGQLARGRQRNGAIKSSTKT